VITVYHVRSIDMAIRSVWLFLTLETSGVKSHNPNPLTERTVISKCNVGLVDVFIILPPMTRRTFNHKEHCQLSRLYYHYADTCVIVLSWSPRLRTTRQILLLCYEADITLRNNCSLSQGVRVMAFNATFNNILAISWW
jgi:hypothetical protein